MTVVMKWCTKVQKTASSPPTSALALSGLVLALVTSLTPGAFMPSQTSGAASTPPSPPASRYVAGAVLAKFRLGVLPFMAEAALADQGLSTTSTIHAIGVRKLAVAPGMELETVAQLRRNPIVEYAEPDFLLEQLSWVPDDISYPSQWNLQKIGMEEAWTITRGAPEVIVAVVDTGLDMSHPDRPANIVMPRSECAGDTGMNDFDGHGTHVAGIISANTNNGIGVAGIAPGVSIMPVNVLCAGVIDTFTESAGIIYAVDKGTRVINLSLGGTGESQAERDAINHAPGREAVVVAAAGNSYGTGNPVFYPAAYPGVLAVGATSASDSRASYSEAQPYVALVAPGGDVASDPAINPPWILSAVPGGYAAKAGTSMSTPRVSALASLIWSVSPALKSAEVTSIMTSTAVDLGAGGRDSFFGWGRIDAYGALKKTQVMSQPPPASTVPAPSPSPTLTPPSPTGSPSPDISPTPTPSPSPHTSRAFMSVLSRSAGLQ